MMSFIDDLKDALLSGDTDWVMNLTQDAVANFISPKQVVEEVLVPVSFHLGEQYEKGEIPITSVLIASRSLLACITVLENAFKVNDFCLNGTLVIGTVAGDIHDLGKSLVISVFKAAGMNVIDLGHDVAPQTFLQAAKDYRPQVIGMSCILTNTLYSMQETIKLIKRSDVANDVKIMVGGRAVTPHAAKIYGADLYSPNCFYALHQIAQLLEHDLVEPIST